MGGEGQPSQNTDQLVSGPAEPQEIQDKEACIEMALPPVGSVGGLFPDMSVSPVSLARGH